MHRWSVAVLVFLATAASSAPPPPKMDPARAALLQTDIEWARQAALGKDVERIVSFWADDAVVYPPREVPVVGKVAIRKYVAGSLKVPWFSINWKPAQVVVAASGEVGYTSGTNEITSPDGNGKVMTSRGRYLTVWRRTATGSWRCVVDFWNEAPPRPPRPPAQPTRR